MIKPTSILFYILILPFFLPNVSSARNVGKQVAITTPTTSNIPNAWHYLSLDNNIFNKKYPIFLFSHGYGEATIITKDIRNFPRVILQNNISSYQ